MRQVKRTSIRWSPLIGFLVVVNVTAGMMYSPITSIVRARVDGARPFDEARLQGILAKLQGIPCARVNPREIESAVLALPEVRTAELTRNPFGSALLTVRYRRPVARVRNTANLALTIDGVLYPANDLSDETLPVLDLPPNQPKVLGTIAAPWYPIEIAKLAARSRENWPDQPLTISFDDRGAVCLNIGTGKVVLGSPTDLDRNFDVLLERLKQNPQELQEVDELNLTAPENPSIRRKQSQKP